MGEATPLTFDKPGLTQILRRAAYGVEQPQKLEAVSVPFSPIRHFIHDVMYDLKPHSSLRQ